MVFRPATTVCDVHVGTDLHTFSIHPDPERAAAAARAMEGAPRSDELYPVWFRASGARGAWEQALAIGFPKALRGWFAEPTADPDDLFEVVASLLRAAFNAKRPDLPPERRERAATNLACEALPNLLFWWRNGTLVERSPALEALLAPSDIADPVPAQRLRLAFPAIYVQLAGSDADYQGVFAFEHRLGPRRALSFSHHRRTAPGHLTSAFFTIVIQDESVPLLAIAKEGLPDEAKDVCLPMLERMTKLLLHMDLKNARSTAS